MAIAERRMGKILISRKWVIHIPQGCHLKAEVGKGLPQADRRELSYNPQPVSDVLAAEEGLSSPGS